MNIDGSSKYILGEPFILNGGFYGRENKKREERNAP